MSDRMSFHGTWLLCFALATFTSEVWSQEGALESAVQLREAQGTWTQIVKLRGERHKLADRIAAIRPIVVTQTDAALRAKNETLLAKAETELAKMDASLTELRRLMSTHAGRLKFTAGADDAAIEAALNTALDKHPGSIPIGKVGVVKGEVWMTDMLGRKSQLKRGDTVLFGVQLETEKTGQIRIDLEDKTVFTVGPESRIVLDEFVYDPFVTPRKIVAQVTKGVFRFVTGVVADKKPASIKIKIPAGTLGFRGTEVVAEVEESGRAVVTMLSGVVDVTLCQNEKVVTVEAGSQIIMSADGKTSEVRAVDAKSIAEAWQKRYGIEAEER